MLVSQSTNTKGLVPAVLGNAEIASLCRAPVAWPLNKVKDMIEARRWFLDMDNKCFGDVTSSGDYAGFGAGYCIDWVYGDRVSYMMDLVDEWKKADPKIVKTIRKLMSEFERSSLRRDMWRNRRGHNGREMRGRPPDPNTVNVCLTAKAIMRECKDVFYG